VVLVDGSASGKLLLEGDGVDQLVAAHWSIAAPSLGQGVEPDSAAVFRLRPDLALVVTPPGGNATLARDLMATADDLPQVSSFVTVMDVTHGHAELWVLGPQARTLLARVCGLDFGHRQFPNMAVRAGSLAKTRQIIRRQDAGELTAFALTGDRSLAAYVWRTILEAGADLGIRPIGATANASLRITD
jgi:4-methylaminobutanoate oxidase (formaldehyde-forming)